MSAGRLEIVELTTAPEPTPMAPGVQELNPYPVFNQKRRYADDEAAGEY